MIRIKLLIVLVALLASCCDLYYDTYTYIKDPLGEEQWYFNKNNKYQAVGHINLNQQHYKGRGVLVSMVDDGLDIYHEDLIDNVGEGNYSYLPEDLDFTKASHGTACAGIIVATEGNGKGVVGIAPQAKIIGNDALKAPAISNLADALVRHKKRVWISNNSWGDFNSWGEPLPLRSLVREALKEGVTNGRNSKGIIYVFSSGNGSSEVDNLPTDNVNYSGLVNNRYTIPVCAVDEHGVRAEYSEIGATVVVCAPSKGKNGELGITTTDATAGKGYNPDLFPDDYDDKNYTKNFSGTSASAPMVSGVAALMLEANPDLNWRDVKAILAKSARVTDKTHPDWTTNGAGLKINHAYGFGLVDADKAIAMAETWRCFTDEIIIEKYFNTDKAIPDNDLTGIKEEAQIDQDITIEFIDIFVDIPDHESIGDLEIVLTSPMGTKSILAEQHRESFVGYFRYNNWRFGSYRHLDENSVGNWQLLIRDKANGKTGTLKSWGIKIYGRSN